MLAAVAILFAPAAFALDPPHDAPPGPSNCSDCHSTHGAAGFFLINELFIQDLCYSCHDGVTATEVLTHINPTKGPWQGRDYDGNGQDIVCVDCHDPHTQLSALGQKFVGFADNVGNNILRQTPGGQRAILYDSTGLRGSYIKNNPDNGMCEVCHSATTTFTFGDDTDTHYGNGTGQACIACHAHDVGFQPSGSTCVECHSQSAGSRRQITDNVPASTTGEFGTAFTSHHVNDGTGAEIATRWDCVVCHAEGDVLTGEPDDVNYHQQNGVQLKNVDTGAVLADWPTLTAAQRSQFCLSCHDTNGATIVAARVDPDPDATTDPLNPFNDGLTNAHEPDGFDGTPAPHSRTRVIDVNAQFNTANTSHHAVLGAAYGSPTPFGSSVDNAIQGVRIDLAWDSTLNCEDCHYGTATTMLSGHGTANARYFLRDLNGNDTLATGSNANCFRCHNPSDSVSVFPEHDKGNHVDDSLTIHGIWCLSCHGGGTWGGIHGVDAPVTDDDGGGSYNPNVFTYGSSLDLMSNWNDWTNNGVSCSTVTAPTRLTDCDQHGSRNWTRIGGAATRTYRNP
jgi:predicted CXXCH cytochrome family protein